MGNTKWSSRDWVWLVGILITIIILLIAGFYNNKAIEMNFSIISSAVSIALALIAIFIALKQDSDNQRVNDRLSHLLNEISANLRNVDAKVDRMDLRLLRGVTEEVLENHSQENKQKDLFTKEEVTELIGKIGNDITTNISNIQNKEKNKEHYKITSDWKDNSIIGIVKRGEVLNIIKNNLGKNLEELQDLIAQETETIYPLVVISNYRKNICDSDAG